MRVDGADPDEPDLFVFAFQELDLSTEALIYSSSTTREDAWCHAIFAALGEKGVKYVKVSVLSLSPFHTLIPRDHFQLASKQLVGMLLLIIVKKSLKSCFGDVNKTAAGAGILGVMV